MAGFARGGVRLACPTWFMLGAALTVFAGCGPKAPYQIVPVSGKVVYDDGEPIPGHRVFIRFYPQVPAASAKESPKPGVAEVKEADGTFTAATTIRYGDGLIVGPQKVTVISQDEKEKPTKAVPKEYMDAVNTPLTVDVTIDGLQPAIIKVPRPAL